MSRLPHSSYQKQTFLGANPSVLAKRLGVPQMGIFNRTMNYNKSYNNIIVVQNKNSGQSSFKLLLAKNIQRPQLKWLDKIDNSNTPFTPYIKTKPNAVKPLEEGTVLCRIVKVWAFRKSRENFSRIGMYTCIDNVHILVCFM